MKARLIGCLVGVVGFLFLLNAAPVTAKAPPKKGDVLPMIHLAAPKDPGHRSYLGLAGDGPFQISQIKAQVVIIEVFSMY